jgi:uncharacterized protein
MSPLERYTRFLVHHAVLFLVGVAIITVGIAAGIGKLETNFDIEASLPAGHPFITVDTHIRKAFGGRNTVMAGIVPKTGDVWQPEVLAVVRDFTLAALRLEDVMAHSVVSLAAPSVRYVEDRDGSLSVDYLMRDVPETPEAIAALRAKVDDDPQLRGLLVTPDQRAALVLLDFWHRAPNAGLAERVLALRAAFADRPVDIYLAGEPLLALTDLEQTAAISRRIPVTFLVIAGMLLLSFRNLQGMVIPMLTATLSTIWALGIMGHVGIAIDTWNAAVPILLIAVAAAHSAQMLKRYVEELVRLGENRAAVIESTIRIGPVMIAAGLTAALGFASLALFGVQAIANFGLSCAFGIASAVVLEMTFIPALRALLPAPRRLPAGRGVVGAVLASFERGILRDGGRQVLVGTAVVLALAVAGATQIRTYGPTREYMPTNSVARTNLEALERHFTGTTTMTLLYEGDAGTATRADVLAHMERLRGMLETDPLVVRTSALSDLVKTLHRTFNPEDPTAYRVPESQELIAQLVFLGESPAFERFTDRSYSQALVIAYLESDDSARVGPLVDGVQRWLAADPAPDGVRLLVAGGMGPTVLAVNEHTTIGKLVNMVAVLASIYVVASLVLRSPLGGLYVVTPIVVSIILLFGLLGWTGIRLDMGSSSILAMSAGIGADYAIYFIYRLREERARSGSDTEAVERAMRTSGRAIVFVAASIGAGFAAMAISPFLGMRLFGTLMPTAMVFSSVAALTVMPVLLLRTRPAFIFGRAGAVPAANDMPAAAG